MEQNPCEATNVGDAPQPKRRCFRFTWPRLFILTLLLAASGIIGVEVWACFFGFPPTWTTAEYDKERYRQIHDAIAADPKHFRGKSFDEVSKALGLADVPLDDSAVQRIPGMERIYHFRGFALDVTLERLPPGITPDSNRVRSANGENPPLGPLRLLYQPFIQIDSLNDRQERMKRFWKRIDDEFEMDRRWQQSRK